MSAAERSCGNCGLPYTVQEPPASGPPGVPPPPPPPPPPLAQSATRRRALPAGLAALGVLVLVGGVGGWLALQGGDDALAFPSDEVFLLPVGGVEWAFMPDLLTAWSTSDLAGPATTLNPPGGQIPAVKGSDELNYAGNRGSPVCDTRALVARLNEDPAMAGSWMEAQGIRADEVASFTAGLTAMVLTQDARVTSFVLDGGTPVARQAVLQAGTAVLVAPTGEPRVRCASGSPLQLPHSVATPTYSGIAWPGFDPADVVEITPCEEPINQFVLLDLATQAIFGRPVGWGIISDFDIAAATTTTSSTTSTTAIPTTTTTSTTTTTLPVADYDASREGTVSASSRLCGAFAAAKAVDGDVTTSWISGGNDAASSTYEWTAAQDEFIGSVGIISNADNATARRRTDHGFAAVTVQVADGSGGVVYEERVELPGTPDPAVLVFPNVVGRSVRLLLEGPETPGGSGFAELTVLVAR